MLSSNNVCLHWKKVTLLYRDSKDNITLCQMPTAIMTVLVLMLRIIYMYACVWYYVQISDGITQFEMWYMSWFSALSAVACGVSRVEWLWSFQQTERQASLAQAGEGPVPCCINGSAVPDWTGPSNKDKSSLQRCGCGGVGSCFGSQEKKRGFHLCQGSL